jgi:ferric-dicitrate binding protein FerR (iron transport regulator)
MDRALAAGEAEELEAHLASCAECRHAAGEYAELTSELEAAFRAEPLRAGLPARPAAPRARRRPRLLRLAAAAAVLAAGGLALWAIWSERNTGPTRGEPRTSPEVAVLANGTRVVRKGPARVRFAGAIGEVEELIQLDDGEIEVTAVRAEPGRRSVRVMTPAGEVETLGTRFVVEVADPGTVRKKGAREGMNRLAAVAAAVMVVSVLQGEVLVSGTPGQAVVRAGEQAEVGGGKLTVGRTNRIIKGRVIKVDGAAVTVSVGSTSGVREGFEFSCKAKGWSGKVLVVRKDSAVLAVKGDAAVGDVATTGFTTVLTEGSEKPGRPPAGPAAVEGGETVDGLKLTLVEGKLVSRTVVREFGPGGAEGGEKVTETVTRTLQATITNVGKKPVILPLVQMPWQKNHYASRPFELHARDANGEAVERVERPKRPAPREAEPALPAVTVLKPGESIRQVVSRELYRLRFQAAGKFKVWVEFEVPAVKEEPLEGQKAWSGKLKSNEVEWENRRPTPRPGAWRGRAGPPRGVRQRQP